MDEKKTFEVEIVFKFDSQQSCPPASLLPQNKLISLTILSARGKKVLSPKGEEGGRGGPSRCQQEIIIIICLRDYDFFLPRWK